ncbi:MAG: hemerythrin domain-containing protein [Caldimonas sp.]
MTLLANRSQLVRIGDHVAYEALAVVGMAPRRFGRLARRLPMQSFPRGSRLRADLSVSQKGSPVKETVPFENAVDLLDADHKAVKKMFVEFNALCDDAAPAEARRALAARICHALTVHSQIEEEIFYPAVRQATGDDPLMDEALAEHAEAKQLIARIQGMKATSDAYDATVKDLGKAIDAHVLEEREQIFLEAQRAPLDLRGLAVPLYQRKKALIAAAPKAKAPSPKPMKKEKA